MVGYNLTEIAGNSTSIVGYAQGINEVLMLGWFGTMFLIGFFLILIMGFYFSTRDVPKSLSAASFIIFILAIFLKALSLIDSITLYVALIISAVTIAFTWKK